MENKSNIPEWDKMQVWSAIEEELGQKKERSTLLWWFFGVLFFVCISGVIILQNSFEENDAESNIKIADTQSDYYTDKPLVESKKNQMPSANGDGEYSLSNLESTVTDAKQENNATKENFDLLSDDNLEDVYSTDIHIPIDESMGVLNNNALVEKISMINSHKSVNVPSSIIEAEGTPSAVEINKGVSHEVLFELPSLPLQVTTLEKSKFSDSLDVIKIEPFLSSDVKRWSFELSYGIGYNKRQMEANDEVWRTAYNEAHAVKESHLFSISSLYQLSEHIGVSLGLSYEHLYELYTYEKKSLQSSNSEVRDSVHLVDIGGQPSFANGQVLVNTYQITTTTTPNTINRLYIPIHLSAHWQNMEFRIGYWHNVWLSRKGVSIAQDGYTSAPIYELDEYGYRDRVHRYSVDVGANVATKFGKMFARASWINDISWHERQDALRTKYGSLNFSIGYSLEL